MSGANCSSPLRYIVWVLCVRAETVRVSENHAGHMSFVFHWWWMDCSFLRLRGVLLWSIVRITADREWIVNMADNGEENRALSSHPQYGTVCHSYIANYIPHSLPVEGGCSRSRSRTIYVGNGRNHIGTHTDLHKLHPYPSPYKSFAELFQKRPFPRVPRFPGSKRQAR